MLLLKMSIYTSFEIFETHLIYLIREYVSPYTLTKLEFDKVNILPKGHRYTIFAQVNDSNISSPIKIGEIDVIIVNDKRVEMRSAVYNLQQTKEGIDFFNQVFHLVYKNWRPISFNSFDSEWAVATETFVSIGMKTGYYKLPGILSIMPENNNSEWIKGGEKSNLPATNSSLLHVDDSEREEIIRKYNTEIDKGLPKVLEDESPSDNKRHNVRPKTLKRFQELREIKEKNPYLSQLGVVMKYNSNHSKEEQIEVWDLQYAYNVMDEDWKNVNELK